MVARSFPRAIAVALAVVAVLGTLFAATPAASLARPGADGGSAGGSPHSGTPTVPLAHAPRAAVTQRATRSADANASGAPAPTFGALYPSSAGTAGPSVRGAVTPRFTTVPAPMGLSDLGVGSGGAYAYYTTSFEGRLSIQSFSAFEPGYLLSPPFQAPDWALLQLDAVGVNITVPPSTPDEVFWAENAVHLNATHLELEDNLWNFTGPGAVVTRSTLAGTLGHIYRGQYYAGFGSLIAVTYPLSLSLYDNITVVGTHDVITFAYDLVFGTNHAHGTYDTVTFGGTTVPTSAPAFEVNGSSSTPSGMLYDSELVFGGNGGGRQTNVLQMDATATLRELSGATYVPVRSAYDFGSDASTTAMGVAAHYLGNNSGGTVYLTQGPSILYGLWNTSNNAIAPEAKPGYINVQLTTVPTYAFVFLQLAGGVYSYAPSSAAGVSSSELPVPYAASPYSFGVWADGFVANTAVPTVADNTSGTQTVTLVAAPGTEQAPLYLNGDAQVTQLVANLPSGAQYSSASKTLWLNASLDALAAPFLRLNPMGYPAFQLFAAEHLSSNVVVNGFRQDPTTFNYTCYSGPCASEYAGWTQGYFFFGGTGRFTVENTTIQGVESLFGQATPTFPVPTIEFYFTTGSVARAISVAHDARGVSAFGATSLVVTNLSVTTGAEGLDAANSSTLGVTLLNAGGTDTAGRPSIGAILDGISTVHLSVVIAFDQAEGLAITNSTDVTLINETVSLGATGINANNTGPAYVNGFNTTGSYVTTAGSWDWSKSLTFLFVTINSTGLTLNNDTGVSVTNGTAIGFGSAVVQNFYDSSSGHFTAILAEDGAAGANLSNAKNITLHYVNAQIDSVGAIFDLSSNVSATDIIAAVNSTGVLWNGGSHATFSYVNVSALSLGVWVSNGSKVNVGNVTAVNNSLGSSDYFTNGTSLIYYPVAGVAVYYASHVNVTNVQATDYPFAVWSNGTHHFNVSAVVGWYAFSTVDENNTTYGNVSQVFSFGSDFGVTFQGCNKTNLFLSTLEDSSLLGLAMNGGGNDSVTDNNFVGNNASSVSGSYSTSHVQVWANDTFGPHFADNFWSDYGGAGSYPINFTGDRSPLSAFYGTYFEFTETGLAGGQTWGVLFGSLPVILADISAVYLPGWVLTDGSLSFLVVAPANVPADPHNGTVAWAGATLAPVNIVFGNPTHALTILGLPVWEFGTIVGVAAAAALGAFFLRRRRRPRTPAGPPPPKYEKFDEPTAPT